MEESQLKHVPSWICANSLQVFNHEAVRKMKNVLLFSHVQAEAELLRERFFGDRFVEDSFFGVDSFVEDRIFGVDNKNNCRGGQIETDFSETDIHDHRAIIAKLQAEGRDKHDVKQQEECLNETLTVLPDSLSRLEKYSLDLKKFLEENFGGELAGAGGDAGESEEGKQIAECKELLTELGAKMPALALEAEEKGAAMVIDEF